MKDDDQADIYNEIVLDKSHYGKHAIVSYVQPLSHVNTCIRNRLLGIGWNMSPQNLLNWTNKGAIPFNKLIPPS